MSIGQTIKRLRRNADMTQEELAEMLSISPQAVSRWETDSTTPDISLIPALVNLFGATADELLGINSAKIEEQAADYKDRLSSLYAEHRYADMLALAREAVKTIPNNLQLIGLLAFALISGENAQNECNVDEAIKHYKSILAKSVDNVLRFRATTALCRLFAEKKRDKEQALFYAKQLPKGIVQTSSYLIERFDLLDDSEKETSYRVSIETYAKALTETVYRLADPNYSNPKNTMSAEQRIALLEKEIEILKAVYGNDLLSENRELYELNRVIGCLWLLAGNKDKAVQSFEAAFRHAVAFDEYKDGSRYSALLLSGVACDDHSLWNGSAVQNFAERIEKQKQYDAVRNDRFFCSLVESINAKL